jgi:hypothetical protein
MTVHTVHVANDKGAQVNVFNLSRKQLSERQVVFLDLATDGLEHVKADDRNPQRCRSEKTGRGPLLPGWQNNSSEVPVMCAYKLVECTFDSYVLWAVSGHFAAFFRSSMLAFNQYVFCLLDQWHGLSIEEVRAREEEFRRMVEAGDNSSTHGN